MPVSFPESLELPDCLMKYTMLSMHLPTSGTGDFAFSFSCLSLIKHKNIISISVSAQWYVLYVHVIYLQFVKAPVKLPITTWCLILGLSIDMKVLKPGRWFCEVKTVLPQARSLQIKRKVNSKIIQGKDKNLTDVCSSFANPFFRRVTAVFIYSRSYLCESVQNLSWERGSEINS